MISLKGKVAFVPTWWVFDSLTGTLYAEGAEIYKNTLTGFLKSRVSIPRFFSCRCRLFPTEKKGMALAEPLDHNSLPLLLEEDREVTEDRSSVVQAYTLRCDNRDPRFTRDLYLALSNFQYYKDWDDSQLDIIGEKEVTAPRVLLLGRDKYFNEVKQYVRVIIPLADGNGVAVTESGETLFLRNTPLDMEVMLIDFLPKHTPNVIQFPKEKSAILIQ